MNSKALTAIIQLLVLTHLTILKEITIQIIHPNTGEKFRQQIASDNLVHHYLSTSSEMSFKSLYYNNSTDLCNSDYNKEMNPAKQTTEMFVLFVKDNGACSYQEKLKKAHPKVRIMFFIVTSIADALKKYKDELDLDEKNDKMQSLEPFNSFGVFIEENSLLVNSIKTKILADNNTKLSPAFDTIVTVEPNAITPKSDIMLNLVSRPFTDDAEMNQITVNHLRTVMKVQSNYQFRRATALDYLISGMSVLKYTTISSGEIQKQTKIEFKADNKVIENNLTSACFRKLASKASGLENGVTTKPNDDFVNSGDDNTKESLKEWKLQKDKFGSYMYRYLFYLNGIYNKYIKEKKTNEVVIDEKLFKTVKLGEFVSDVKSCVATYKAKLTNIKDWATDDEFLALFFVVEINDYSNKDFEIFTPFYLIEKKMAEVGPYCQPSSCPLQELMCFNLTGIDSCNKRGVYTDIDFEGKGEKFGCSDNKVPDNNGVCGGDEWGNTNSSSNLIRLFKRAFIIILIVLILLIIALVLIRSNDRVGKTIDNMYRGLYSRRRSTFSKLIDKKNSF